MVGVGVENMDGRDGIIGSATTISMMRIQAIIITGLAYAGKDRGGRRLEAVAVIEGAASRMRDSAPARSSISR